MDAVLAVLEQRDGQLKPVSREVLAAARAVADASGRQVVALVLGPAGMSLEGLGGADRVRVAEAEAFRLYQAEGYTRVAVEQARQCETDTVLLAATAAGRDLAPRLAAGLEATLAADVTGLSWDEGLVVRRPSHAGKVVQTLRVRRLPCVVSIRTRHFEPLGDTGAAACAVESAPVNGTARGSETVEVRRRDHAAQDVAEAKVVVSGGRGLREAQGFALIERLAAALDGAVGASRAVVDAGWRPHAEQVGQTGKTVAPDLYVAVGISGAIQHLAGMQTARTVVAINRDPDAPIFRVADYGIVGDLFEVVPTLTDALRRLRES